MSTNYTVTLTDSGKWMHAPGSDFLFAYIDNGWSVQLKEAVASAFETALGMSSKIKEAVKDTSGTDVVNGLYLVNEPDMIKAMNSIDGMGETSVDQKNQSGSGTAVTITKEFFTAVLAGVSGNVEPMMAYLTEEIQKIQGQAKKSGVKDKFGTVVGLISVMPELDVPVTTFQYAYSDSKTSKWFVSVPCGHAEHYSYDYDFTVVDFNFNESSYVPTA